jgi:hypothetical protein
MIQRPIRSLVFCMCNDKMSTVFKGLQRLRVSSLASIKRIIDIDVCTIKFRVNLGKIILASTDHCHMSSVSLP